MHHLPSHPVLERLNQPFIQTSHCSPVTPARHEHCPPYAAQVSDLLAPTELPQSHSVNMYIKNYISKIEHILLTKHLSIKFH